MNIIQHLLNDSSVTRQEGGEVVYMQLLFDRHEVVYAEGAATETFNPGVMGLSVIPEASREELFTLFPELRAMPDSYGPTARHCLKRHEGVSPRV